MSYRKNTFTFYQTLQENTLVKEIPSNTWKTAHSIFKLYVLSALPMVAEKITRNIFIFGPTSIFSQDPSESRPYENSEMLEDATAAFTSAYVVNRIDMYMR